MAYTREFKDAYSWPKSLYFNGSAIYSTYDNVTFTGSRTGEKMPDWKQKLKDGLSATTAYTSNRYSLIESGVGSASCVAYPYSIHQPNEHPTLSQNFSGYSPVPSVIVGHLGSTSAAEAMALNLLYRKIDSETTRINSLASIAEFGDVLRQFGHPFQAIIDLTNRRLNRLALERRGLKGSTVFKRIKWLEIVASSYLEYAFGLAPLISDTEKAAEALAKWQYEKTGESRFRSRVTSRGTVPVNSHTYGDPQFIPSSWIIYNNVQKVETENRCSYAVGLSTSTLAEIGSTERLYQLLGFDPVKFIPAAWEVVPWSWLVDYFTNVGDILNAAAVNTSGVTWISKSVSQRTLLSSSSPVNSTLTSGFLKSYGYEYGSGSGSGGNFKILRTTVTRTIPVSLGVPPLTFTLPSMYGQLANMAAVLVSRRPSSSALWLT